MRDMGCCYITKHMGTNVRLYVHVCMITFYFNFFRTADPQEGLGWYLLGRCYMAAHKHELAYAAYEQAV